MSRFIDDWNGGKRVSAMLVKEGRSVRPSGLGLVCGPRANEAQGVLAATPRTARSASTQRFHALFVRADVGLPGSKGKVKRNYFASLDAYEQKGKHAQWAQCTNLGMQRRHSFILSDGDFARPDDGVEATGKTM
eukprot:4993468-Pleurochrysis_carterae.AAC.1